MSSIPAVSVNQKAPSVSPKQKNDQVCSECSKSFGGCRCNRRMYKKMCMMLNLVLLMILCYMLCKLMSNSSSSSARGQGPFRLVRRY
jgi:hypothetical protein